MRNITDAKGGLNSVYPCTEYLTFGPWIYMVPQYKPQDVLMLGVAGATTAGLIHLIYGDVPMTGVDLTDYKEDLYGMELIIKDAREFIKDCKHYDTIIIDLYPDGEYEPCDFVSDKGFADEVKKKGNYIIVHVSQNTDMSAWEDIRCVKVLSLNKDRFYYFRTTEIHVLPIV